MHTLTVQTKFTFGDRVRFDSPIQGRSGVGSIVGITAYAEGPHDYIINVDDDPLLQPGILEDEINLAE